MRKSGQIFFLKLAACLKRCLPEKVPVTFWSVSAGFYSKWISFISRKLAAECVGVFDGTKGNVNGS